LIVDHIVQHSCCFYREVDLLRSLILWFSLFLFYLLVCTIAPPRWVALNILYNTGVSVSLINTSVDQDWTRNILIYIPEPNPLGLYQLLSDKVEPFSDEYHVINHISSFCPKVSCCPCKMFAYS
jgi:hypothetical protein